jgi:RHS repeat-associated protein
VAEPHAEYIYDAIYRLIEATGREHIGQSNLPVPGSWDDAPRVHLPHPHDGQAMRRYLERYEYDAVGNFLKMIHQAANGSWTREYAYEEPSLLEFTKTSNRLSRTTIGATTEPYSHDAHGNMTSMPHLPLMRWDFKDQLRATSQQVVNNGGTPEITYYVYDASGQRVRKVTERQAGPGQTPTRMKERIYLGGFEIYREYAGDGQTVTLARETLHLMDDKQRIALVETRTQGSDPAPQQLIRYQLGNHLGSASLELDEQAQIISYEEFYPYGSTSYQAVRSQTETRKRYRYTGKERDEESGLYYHGARYYAAWVGRWTEVDPSGTRNGTNAYIYVSNNPARLIDPNGRDSADAVIPTIRREVLAERGSEDFVESLARSFTDTRITDRVTSSASAPEARLETILDATEHNVIRGLQTGGAVQDWRDAGFRREFVDPHPSSANQVGHFLTAVRLGFDPGSVTRSAGPRTSQRPSEHGVGDLLRVALGEIVKRDYLLRSVRIRDIVDPLGRFSNEEVALRLIIGHEKAPDPLPGQPEQFLRQFNRATDADIQVFRKAELALGSGHRLNIAEAMVILRQISIDSSMRGNSYEDLALSLVGWHFGRLLREGHFTSTAQVADWLRVNLGGHAPSWSAQSSPSSVRQYPGQWGEILRRVQERQPDLRESLRRYQEQQAEKRQ